MRKSVVVLLLTLALSGIGAAQTKSVSASSAQKESSAAADGVAVLPVKRVVLYKNGVGYFEHSGKVRGNQDLAIEFTTAQLNDVLKSLTAVDLGGGQITGVRYNSIAPLSERLKTLQIGLGEDVTAGGFLGALRGTRVEVRSGAVAVTGKILSVETVKRETAKGGTVEVTQLSIVGDGGELRSFEMGPGVAVRIVDGEIRQDVGRYLSLVGSTRSKDVRKMTISAAGTGERQLFVSYISEVPVWKSTYRIVIPKAPGTPFLQGWAIVDNTVGEDWKDVQLSLVSGAPQSFIQNISQPYYTRRPVVALPESAMLTPQEHEASMEEETPAPGAPADGLPGGTLGGVLGGIIAPPPPLPAATASPTSVRISQGVAEGMLIHRVDPRYPPLAMQARIQGQVVLNALINAEGDVENVSVVSGHPMLTASAVDAVRQWRYRPYYLNGKPTELNTQITVSFKLNEALLPNVATESAAISSYKTFSAEDMERSVKIESENSVLGDLFQYSPKQKITVLQNQSAIVPIVQSRLEAEKVTLWNSQDHLPLRALWLKNTSGLVLDGGTFNILEEDAFAGEGVMDVLHPDERRLLSYAADTALHVKTDSDEDTGMATKVVINHGMLSMTREERSTSKYEIHNADSTARDVVIEHPIRENFKLVDGVKPEESSTNYHRFKIKVDPKKTETLVVKEVRPDITTVYLSSITDDQVAYFVREAKLKPEVEQSLRKIIGKKDEIAGVDRDVKLRQQELTSIDRDQNRVRENMKALKGSAEEKALLQRYTKQLDSQEDRINVLRGEIAQLQTKRSQLQSELDQMIQNVDVNADM